MSTKNGTNCDHQFGFDSGSLLGQAGADHWLGNSAGAVSRCARKRLARYAVIVSVQAMRIVTGSASSYKECICRCPVFELPTVFVRAEWIESDDRCCTRQHRCGRYGWSRSGKRRCRKCRCRRGGEAVGTGVNGGVGGNAVGVGVSVDVGEDMGVRARITVEVDCGAVVAVVMGVDTGVAIGIEVAKGIESG